MHGPNNEASVDRSRTPFLFARLHTLRTSKDGLGWLLAKSQVGSSHGVDHQGTRDRRVPMNELLAACAKGWCLNILPCWNPFRVTQPKIDLPGKR